MVFQPDGELITVGSECDLICMGISAYLSGSCDRESHARIHEHLNECDACHKHLFKVAFQEG
jgi:predicted anti-sigma-YlaC factor YlaD